MRGARIKVNAIPGIQHVPGVADRKLQTTGDDVEPLFPVMLIKFAAVPIGRDRHRHRLKIEGLGRARERRVGQPIGRLSRRASPANDHALGPIIRLLEQGGDRNTKPPGNRQERTRDGWRSPVSSRLRKALENPVRSASISSVQSRDSRMAWIRWPSVCPTSRAFS